MLVDLLAGCFAFLLLTAPGWWLARHHRLPLPVLAGFLSGAALLLTAVLALQLAGLGFTRAALAAAWLAWTLVVLRLTRRTPPGSQRSPFALHPSPLTPHLPLLLVAIIPTLAVLGWRATAHPLFGVDTGFRWGYLAELMATHHSLDFYPPHTDADYALYVWPDGIPPLVSTLYFGTYTLLGRIARVATAPLVLAQFLLLLGATAALARRLFSLRAAVFAAALLAVTPLAAWAATMGQETGLTALALVALLLYLPSDRAEATPAALLAAGLAAAVGALAREYGWAFVIFGAVLALHRGRSLRALAWFAAPVLLLAAPWYARNLALTGNPLFNQALGGLLPVNAGHARLMLLYHDVYRLLPQLREQPTFLLANAAAVLAASLVGATLFFRQSRALILAAGLVVALWLLSVRDTAAGLANSLRVLSPALALGAVLGGAAWARFVTSPRRRILFLLLLAAFSADAALRALTLPNNTYALAPAHWLGVDRAVEAFQDRPVYHELVRRTAGTRVLALGPNVYLAQLGLDVAPPWSPGLAFLFDPHVDAGEARSRLYAAGFRFVLVAKSRVNQNYLAQCPAFASATSAELVPVLDRDNLVLFALAPPR